MDNASKLRFTHLREVLAAGRLEKSGLVIEIASSDTTPRRKQQAIRRYSSLMKELRLTADELENLIAATKQSQAARDLL